MPSHPIIHFLNMKKKYKDVVDRLRFFRFHYLHASFLVASFLLFLNFHSSTSFPLPLPACFNFYFPFLSLIPFISTLSVYFNFLLPFHFYSPLFLSYSIAHLLSTFLLFIISFLPFYFHTSNILSTCSPLSFALLPFFFEPYKLIHDNFLVTEQFIRGSNCR